MAKLKIEKRDGKLEEWNYDKIILSIGKAMMPVDRAEKIAKNVEKWAQQNAKKGVVTSNQIRDKVIEYLKDEDPVAAESYELYKKP